MFDWFTNLWSSKASAGYGLRIPPQRSTAGETITHKTASTVSTYFSAIRNISEDIGKIPSPVYRVDGNENKTHAKNHPVYRILNLSPNPMMTAMTFKELVTSWALGWGNGFAEIIRDPQMNVTAMWPIHPARVQPWVGEDSELYYYVYPEYDIRHGETFHKGEPVILAAWQMFHLKGPTDFGIWGKSALEHMAESLGISIASQKYGAAFYGNGAHAGGVLKHPSELSEEAGNRLRKSYDDNNQGAGRSGKTILLEEGMEFQSTTINPKDAQALELRQFQVIEVCRFFRIQPHKIQELNQANYANLESQNLDYVTDTLLSWGQRWQLEAEMKLLPESDLMMELDFSFLLKGDRAGRVAYYNTMHFMGAMSVNNILRLEGMNSIGPEGDVHYQQSAMVPLGHTEAETNQASFDAVVVNASQRVAMKEARACEAESKKERDHSEWAASFWQDQTSFALSNFMPIISTMSSMKMIDGPETIKAFTENITSAYSGRELTPLTAHEITEVFNASKR